MTKEIKDFLLTILFGSILVATVACALYWASKGMEYNDSGETRIVEKVFADGRIEYVPQKKRENQFFSYWVQIGDYESNVISCSNLYRLTRKKDEHEKVGSLGCTKKVIDAYLSNYESSKIVKENYIKYP